MTSIPVAICRFSDNNFKRFHLRKKDPFSIFMAFLQCAWNLEHSQKKEECPSIIITEIIAYEIDIYLSV